MYTKGDEITVKDGLLRGAEGYVLRVSKRTAGLVVKLTKVPDVTVYKVGAEIEIAQYEVRFRTDRTERSMAMLPNQLHPGPGCSCRECQEKHPCSV